MTHIIVNPTSLTPPSGYAHGVVAQPGRLVFMAGQTGTNVAGAIASPGAFVLQFTQALKNLLAIVQEAGGEWTDVVSLTIFVTNKGDYIESRRAIGEAYRKLFGAYYPAMTLVQVKGLLDDAALVEIQGMAVVGAG